MPLSIVIVTKEALTPAQVKQWLPFFKPGTKVVAIGGNLRSVDEVIEALGDFDYIYAEIDRSLACELANTQIESKCSTFSNEAFPSRVSAVKWEEEVYTSLEQTLEIDRSDAQSIVMSQHLLMTECWVNQVSSEEAAKLLDRASVS